MTLYSIAVLALLLFVNTVITLMTVVLIRHVYNYVLHVRFSITHAPVKCRSLKQWKLQ